MTEQNTKKNKDKSSLSIGSTWHRWEPHIHAPGTLMNDQFGGNWDAYLTKIEKSDPPIRALGVTDYCVLDSYKKVLKKKDSGRLRNVELIFPNIELRLDIPTKENTPINMHLLFSANASIQDIQRVLDMLTYSAYNDTYSCNNQGLIRLGKRHDSKCKEDAKALEIGANQFKVSLQQLQKIINQNDWFKTNACIAVSAKSNDGTSGLSSPDESFASRRKEIEKLADIIFSPNPNDVKFWLGEGRADVRELIKDYGGKKPCLHGSDAHKIDEVGNPCKNRYTWIKGNLTFEDLKQSTIEPEGRVFIGEEKPNETMPSYTISKVSTKNASWIKNNNIPLNPNLVAIIGARGSGKTALADIIAVAAESTALKGNSASFVGRANKLLRDAEATLHWEDGEVSLNKLCDFASFNDSDKSKVQYLSQQFVEKLCSSDGVIAKDLVKEIEQVIFHSHIRSKSMGATSFEELKKIKLSNILLQKSSTEEQIKEYVDEINNLREQKEKIPNKKSLLESKEQTILGDEANRKSLQGKSKDSSNVDENTNRLAKILETLDNVKSNLDSLSRRKNSLVSLKEEIENKKIYSFPSELKKIKSKYSTASLSDEQWDSFELKFKGDVERILDAEINKVKKDFAKLCGEEISELTDENLNSLFARGNDELAKQPYNTLKATKQKLEKSIGIKKENITKIEKLTQKITLEKQACKKLEDEIKVTIEANKNIKNLLKMRRDSYRKVFGFLIAHEKILTELYAPLVDNLKDRVGSLKKLTFNVKRTVDIDKWCQIGEGLLNLSKSGNFRGHGALKKSVEEKLLGAWQTGDANKIAEAMNDFLTVNEKSIESQCKYDKSDEVKYRQWRRDVSEWLYSTEHISINYSIQYDGTDIEQLSPGTRGIVLLLLYLAIDKTDFRPLIIDQPEENLDPKSIFDELVPAFRSAKVARQIIVVTHNANLVVNTDAEQVIVASAKKQKKGELPEITYISGGLEDKEIRNKVCEILEGGEEAFKKRAERLRVSLK